MVKQLSDVAPFAMMGFEFAMAVAIALFQIASATGNFLALPSALAAVILSLLCLPMIIMLYWSEDDAGLRRTFQGLIVYFVIQTVSGVTWYLLSMAISDPIIVDLAMLLMVVGYVPLLIALHATIRMQHLNVRPVFRHLMMAAGIFTIIMLAALVATRVLTDPGNAYHVSIFAASIVADLLIIGMCSILVLRNIRNGRRTIFAILLATFRVSMAIDMDSAMFDVDTAIPCGLIINELVSNSLKYAFPGGRAGVIAISLQHDGDRYVLEVSDDGVGLPDGMDVRNVPSMGLQLVNILAGSWAAR